MLAILYFLYLIYFLYFPSISFCSRASRHRRGASRDARCACRIFSRWAAAARRARLRDRAARRRVRPRRAAQAAIASVRAECPRERWQWLLALHAAAERDAWQRGLEDVHAWLPPPIAKKFGKRIARLGWLRDDAWTPYCKNLWKGSRG